MRFILALITLLIQPAVAISSIDVHVDAKCPDKTIEYNIANYAQNVVRKSTIHKLVPGSNNAVMLISMSAAPVKQNGTADSTPLGISFAVLVRKKNSNGYWDVTSFQNYFIPIDEIEKTVQNTIIEVLQ